MFDELNRVLGIAIPWGSFLLIGIIYLAAWLLHWLTGPLAVRLLRLGRLAPRERKISQERQDTLRGLLAGILNFLLLATATLLSLSLFIDAATLIWMVGLFSAAFGLGARPLVSDFLTGISFIFENAFEVGDKVELPGLPGGTIEGAVEAVNFRTTLVRATSGEPYTVPNGEIRVVRNFSRGRFSTANIRLRVGAADFNRTLRLLEQLADEALTLLPNLLEPWQVISETGEMGQQTELTLLATARFGKAAEMRPRLLALVQERLEEAGIELAG